jgi:hypothetical protein
LLDGETDRTAQEHVERALGELEHLST